MIAASRVHSFYALRCSDHASCHDTTAHAHARLHLPRMYSKVHTYLYIGFSLLPIFSSTRPMGQTWLCLRLETAWAGGPLLTWLLLIWRMVAVSIWVQCKVSCGCSSSCSLSCSYIFHYIYASFIHLETLEGHARVHFYSMDASKAIALRLHAIFCFDLFSNAWDVSICCLFPPSLSFPIYPFFVEICTANFRTEPHRRLVFSNRSSIKPDVLALNSSALHFSFSVSGL